MTQTAAQTALPTAKLLLGSVLKKPSTTVPSGDVISQTPVGGTVVCQNSNVSLAVSCGLPTTVPNVVGLPAPTAKNDIIAAHLVVGTITTAHSSTIPAGDVISTNPKGGTLVCQGTVVNGVVSLGHKGDTAGLVFADFPSDQRFPRSDRFSGGVLKSYV